MTPCEPAGPAPMLAETRWGCLLPAFPATGLRLSGHEFPKEGLPSWAYRGSHRERGGLGLDVLGVHGSEGPHRLASGGEWATCPLWVGVGEPVPGQGGHVHGSPSTSKAVVAVRMLGRHGLPGGPCQGQGQGQGPGAPHPARALFL